MAQMATETEISWTDSTFNPWIGCSKVSAGCQNCYAETMDRRFKWGGVLHWGPDTKPIITSQSEWAKPLKYQREAEKNNTIHRLFCGSLHDFADTRAPKGARERLWALVRRTPNIRWQMLTKRPKAITRALPDDWRDGYDNVSIGVTVENIAQGVPRIELLKKIPCAMRFLSIEPLLEDLGQLDLTNIGWVIVGGESGRGARPMNIDWAISVKEQCARQNVPFFYKQLGSVRGHGDCLIDGIEVKEWPDFLVRNTAVYQQRNAANEGVSEIIRADSATAHCKPGNPTAPSADDKGADQLYPPQVTDGNKKRALSNVERQNRFRQAHNTAKIDIPANILELAGQIKDSWGLNSKIQAIEVALLMAAETSDNPGNANIKISIPIFALSEEAKKVAQADHDCIIILDAINTVNDAQECSRYVINFLTHRYSYPAVDYVAIRAVAHGCELEVGHSSGIDPCMLLSCVCEAVTTYLTTVINNSNLVREAILFRTENGKRVRETRSL